MAIQFQEIRQYLARNVRLSICFDGGYYHDYLMISDIPAEKYKDLYVFGIGMVDVEFSMDIYTSPKDLDGVIMSSKDNTMEPAIEIVLEKSPRNIERKSEDVLLFLYRKFLKSSEIVYNRLEIKNDIAKERRGLRHDVVYEVFCFGLG